MVEDLDLKAARIHLRGVNLEGNGDRLRFGEDAHGLRVVVGIPVLDPQTLVRVAREWRDSRIRPTGTVEVPFRNGRTDVEAIKLVIDGPLHPVTHRHGRPADPHVLLVHAVGDPQVGAGRVAIPFRNAAHILRPKVLRPARESERRDFAIHHQHVLEANPVFTSRDGQRPAMRTEVGRVVDDGIAVVVGALPPGLGARGDDAGNFDRTAPRLPLIR